MESEVRAEADMTTRFRAETILKDAAKALLIVHRGVNTWIPKSQIEAYQIQGDGTVIFAITDWIAEQKGISDETEAIRAMLARDERPAVRRRSEKPPPYRPPKAEPVKINPVAPAVPELDLPDAPAQTGGDVFEEVKPATPPKKTVRVFLAHAKGTTEAAITVMKSTVIRILSERAAGRAHVSIVTGFEDWEANFKRAGGWDAWARDVVERIDFATRERVYAAIVVTDLYLGKATAQIVGCALHASPKLPSFFLNGPKLERIIGVDEVDPNSFRAGWKLRVEETTK